MKIILSFVGTILAGIAAWILGYSLPILVVVNLIWLLVKDQVLFSWWVIVYVLIGFIVSVLVTFGSTILMATFKD